MPITPTLASLESALPLAAVLLPAVAAMICYRIGTPLARDRVAILGIVSTAGLVAALLASLAAGRTPTVTAGELTPGIAFTLAADPLGGLFAGFVAVCYLIAVPLVVVDRRLRSPAPGARVHACLLASQAAALCAAFAGNLLLLFIALEILTLVTYPLVAHAETRRARRAAYAYLAYAFGGGLALLGGIRVVYAQTGSVDFVTGGIPALTHSGSPRILSAAMALFVVGFGVKMAAVPLHSWLFRARAAPPLVYESVFVTVVTTAGVVGLGRVILQVFGPSELTLGATGGLLLGLAAITALYAGTMAIATERAADRFVALSITGGAIALVGFATASGTLSTAAIGIPMLHALLVLVALVALSVRSRRTDATARPRDARVPATLVLRAASGALVGLTWLLLVAAVALPLEWRTDRAWLVISILFVVAIAHTASISPIVRERAVTETHSLAAPDRSILGRIAEQLRTAARTVEARGDRAARAVLRSVRAPETAIEAALPARVRPWYRRRRSRTVGATGTKLGVEESLYVLGAVLALALLVGLR